LKIYTGFGDKGKTRLYGGEIVDKDHLRVKAYGAMDEVNSVIGLLITDITTKDLIDTLQSIQYKIFELSAELAAVESTRGKLKKPAITDEIIKELEDKIDSVDNRLNPLKNFILPGGSRGAAFCHLARTVCRRAEREITTLSHSEQVDNRIIIYVNRLSDYFFVLGRLINKDNKIEDVLWKTDT
jgi:cob(I)alamin adenosyltransferase